MNHHEHSFFRFSTIEFPVSPFESFFFRVTRVFNLKSNRLRNRVFYFIRNVVTFLLAREKKVYKTALQVQTDLRAKR